MSNGNPAPAPATWRVAAAFAIVYVVWGSTYLAIYYAIETLPPLLMAGTRFLIAGALLYPFARRSSPPATAVQWRTTIIAGLLMLLGGNGLVCWAEQHVATGLAALLVATVSLWMVLLDWLVFRGSRPSVRIWAGVALGLSGVVVLVDPVGLAGEPVHLGGAAGLILACLMWAAGSLYSRRHPMPASAFQATAMEMLAGGAGLMLAATLGGEWSRVRLADVSWLSVLSVGYLIVFGSILALTSYVWLLQVTTPARVATYAYVNPVVAMLLGYFLAGEPLTWRSVAAAGIIIAAVCLITTAPARPAPRSRERVADPAADGIAERPGPAAAAPPTADSSCTMRAAGSVRTPRIPVRSCD
jgi:drug/metabolite transporter (DMT)-like permease